MGDHPNRMDLGATGECPQGLRLGKQIFHVGALTWFYDAQQVRPLLESQAEPADFSPARVRLVSVRQGV